MMAGWRKAFSREHVIESMMKTDEDRESRLPTIS
jgi:hypothetical protein